MTVYSILPLYEMPEDYPHTGCVGKVSMLRHIFQMIYNISYSEVMILAAKNLQFRRQCVYLK